MAVQTAGKMRHVWASKQIPLKLKLRVYITGVCSQLTYGSEAWRLDEQTIRMLNGANIKMNFERLKIERNKARTLAS